MAVTARMLAPARTRSKSLTREVVTAAALDIVAAEGLGALTMRKLGAALNVSAATIYNVMPGKEELFQALADSVIAKLEEPSTDLPAADALIEYYRRMHANLTRHPAVAQLAAAHPVLSPTAMRVREGILKLLREGGLGPEDAASAYSTLESYVMGFTLTRIGRRNSGRGELLAGLPADDFPELHAVAPYFATHATDEQQFVDGLRTILGAILPLRSPKRRRR